MWRWGLLCVAVGLGVIVTRVFWDGRAALAAGDEALARGDVDGAVTGWRRAARWYAPLAPHVTAAYERLAELARAAESRGDGVAALAAWRAVRSSALSTRSFYQPHAADLELANGHIARLMAAEEKAGEPARDEAARAAFHLELLRRDDAPRLGFTLLALAGFAAWVGGGFWFALRGVTAADQLDRLQALRGGGLVLAGLVAWMVGLYWA